MQNWKRCATSHRRDILNEHNLIPNSERSPEELREMGRKGGIASGKARRKKRDTIKMAKLFLEVFDKLEGKERAKAKQVLDRWVKETVNHS